MKRCYRLSPQERCRIRDQIASELAHYPDVVFAYLYGSFAGSVAFHDVDIAVYLSGEKITDDVAARLSQHLSAKVKLPVDVRILNAAPVSFRFHVLRGECLLSHDEGLRTDIIEDTVRRYLDIAPLLRRSTKEAFAP